jgi:hypothetical protein
VKLRVPLKDKLLIMKGLLSSNFIEIRQIQNLSNLKTLNKWNMVFIHDGRAIEHIQNLQNPPKIPPSETLRIVKPYHRKEN